MKYKGKFERAPNDFEVHQGEKEEMKPGDILEVDDHRWRVRGVHLGAIGVESLIEIENISHQPGWTGAWETHQLMFVPEILLRQAKVVDWLGAARIKGGRK